MDSTNSVQRVDGVAKVTGKARYTEDFSMPGMRTARYLRSPIAHGYVKTIDVTKAQALPGVDGVFTFADVPKNPFPTAGHPFSLDPSHQDVADRLLLTEKVRYQGDEIAVVVADSEITARRALDLIEVEYQTEKPLVRERDILAPQAPLIHAPGPNLLGSHEFKVGGDWRSARDACSRHIEGQYATQVVQHCHLENQTAYAYMEDTRRIVVVSATQIPHIVRRIVGQALQIPVSRIKVIKPYVGGGFGNKQDVILEPMVAFLTLRLGGAPVRITLDREECMTGTRVRHPISANVRLSFTDDGELKLIDYEALSNTGAYASHGHTVVAAGSALAHYMYPRALYRCQAKTIYGNIPAGGAMRGYGVPQITFILESAVEDAARSLGMDSVEFRLKNAARTGDKSGLAQKPLLSCGLVDCLKKGRELIGWDKKRAEIPREQNGALRRGLGVACFSFGSGTYPVSLEIGSARLALNQDGTVHLQVGATEIGQGSDTAFAQMAALTLGLETEAVTVVSTQDTDVTPFDTGAYATRQTYVSGHAVVLAAHHLKEKILAHAGLMSGLDPEGLDLAEGQIVFRDSPQSVVMSFMDLALDSYYDKQRGGQITAEASHKTQSNAYPFGCTFVDLSVDIPLCKVRINQIFNIHDSGRIINRLNAAGQVHGGMGMGIGAALYEEMLIDPDSGRIFNNNLLDYKVPTIMDLPDLGADFVESHEPTHPLGSKGLGEPPLVPVAPAIRNAVLDATGVALNRLPLSPGNLFKAFKAEGLL